MRLPVILRRNHKSHRCCLSSRDSRMPAKKCRSKKSVKILMKCRTDVVVTVIIPAATQPRIPPPSMAMAILAASSTFLSPCSLTSSLRSYNAFTTGCTEGSWSREATFPRTSRSCTRWPLLKISLSSETLCISIGAAGFRGRFLRRLPSISRGATKPVGMWLQVLCAKLELLNAKPRTGSTTKQRTTQILMNMVDASQHIETPFNNPVRSENILYRYTDVTDPAIVKYCIMLSEEVSRHFVHLCF